MTRRRCVWRGIVAASPSTPSGDAARLDAGRNILFEQKLHSKFPQIKKIDNGIWCSSPWIFWRIHSTRKNSPALSGGQRNSIVQSPSDVMARVRLTAALVVWFRSSWFVNWHDWLVLLVALIDVIVLMTFGVGIGAMKFHPNKQNAY